MVGGWRKLGPGGQEEVEEEVEEATMIETVASVAIVAGAMIIMETVTVVVAMVTVVAAMVVVVATATEGVATATEEVATATEEVATATVGAAMVVDMKTVVVIDMEMIDMDLGMMTDGECYSTPRSLQLLLLICGINYRPCYWSKAHENELEFKTMKSEMR
jgi:hypothetical protein